jgi:Flp pilus assembly pilin Flp
MALMGGLLRREEGQTVVEYGLLLSVILLVSFAVIVGLGLNVVGLFQTAVAAIS